MVEAPTLDIGVLAGEGSGQKLAGVTRPPSDDVVGVGSMHMDGCRVVRLSGANGHTVVRQADDVTF